LDQALAGLPRVQNQNVLVGFDTCDDAGVYRLTPECALVQTVDFFTPIVDDAYTFGAIAAANSLSDVYAMGGTPVTALSILAYPPKGDMDDLREILRGGAEKIAGAGCALVGGHSIADDEIKFGYSITGTVHPDRVLANSGARAGDALVLTKRIGTGVISTALKQGIAADDHVRMSVESMLLLNREGAEIMLRTEAHGCTDISGFGLLGHAREMAIASNVTLEIDSAAVPFMPGALEYAHAGAQPGGLRNNREFAGPSVEFAREIAVEVEALLYDPQTSGGLLVSVAEQDASAYPFRIGRVLPRGHKPLRIL
jgi:selenide,water dikinase